MMTLDETITTSITMSHVLRKLPAGGNGRHIAAGKVKRCAPCDDEAAKLCDQRPERVAMMLPDHACAHHVATGSTWIRGPCTFARASFRCAVREPSR
jgi:hypothetical protein